MAGTGDVLWNQNTGYNLLCRLTGTRWEDGGLEHVNTKPMGITMANVTNCVHVLAGHIFAIFFF